MSGPGPGPESRTPVVDRTLEIDAVLGSLRVVGPWLRDAARDGGVPYEVAFGMDLAMYEAVDNIIRYAWEDGVPHRIEIRLRGQGHRVEVEIADDGRAFDPLSVPAPDKPHRIEDIIPGGQGVHLMRHFTDDIFYRREAGRNVLTLVREWVPREEGT
jgi:serine/threonine-protein kinase RsbW